MKITKLIYATVSMLLLTSCYDPDTTMTVVDNMNGKELTLVDKRGKKHSFPSGQYEAKLTFNHNMHHMSQREKREMMRRGEHKGARFIVKTANGKKEFKFNIESKDDFLYTNAPMTISSKQLGQPVTMLVSRDVEKELDRINVSLFDAEHSSLLATMQFVNKNGSSKNSFDEKNGEFLQSFQKVKMSQRSLVFEIDAAVDSMFWYLSSPVDVVFDVADNMINYGAMIYISPWVYSRYYKVNWLLSDDSDSREAHEKAFQKSLKQAPVVDYVTWVHSGNQWIRSSYLEGKKENQLRMVYVGACSSGSSSAFIRDHNAAYASGHRSLSASPLFQFSFFRNWAYGRSFKKSLGSAYFWGVAKARVLEYATFAFLWQDLTGLGMWSDVDDLIESSEPMLSYTKELKASEAYVGLSAAPKRANKSELKIYQEYSSELTYGEDEKAFMENY